MLRLRRTGGNVHYLRSTLQRAGPRTVSNGKADRDAAGSIVTDKQWSRAQFVYKVTIDTVTRDFLWQLYKDSDPILTPSGATNLFEFHDDEILSGWVTCTHTNIEHKIGNRLLGRQETYEVEVTFECSVSDYDTYRRTA